MALWLITYFFSLSGPFCKIQPDQMKVLDTPPGCCSVERFCCWAEEGTVCLYQIGTDLSDPFRESNPGQRQPFALVWWPLWWQPQLHPSLMKSVKHSICYHSLSLQSSRSLLETIGVFYITNINVLAPRQMPASRGSAGLSQETTAQSPQFTSIPARLWETKRLISIWWEVKVGNLERLE